MTTLDQAIIILYLEDGDGCYLTVANACIETNKESRLELDVVCEKTDKSVPMTTDIAMSHPTIFVHIQASLVATLKAIPMHRDVSFE